MSNASISLRTLRTLTCASLATLMIAACGGGGGGGKNPGTDTDTASAGGSSSGGKNAVVVPGNSAPTEGPDGQDASKYELTFADEFENGFNRDIWNDQMWYETGNKTINYAVEDGSLKIWPQRDANGNFFKRTLDTDGKYYQTYGYFEIKAKLPKGHGTWPAFWLFNHINERRPEMDVMEAYGGGEGWGFIDSQGVARPTVYAPTVWRGDNDQNPHLLGTRMYETGHDLSDGFHTYAVKWEPNKQTYYFDGKEVLVLNISMADPMYLMLDLWQGSAAGMMDSRTPQGKTNSFEIQYIRAWKFK